MKQEFYNIKLNKNEIKKILNEYNNSNCDGEEIEYLMIRIGFEYACQNNIDVFDTKDVINDVLKYLNK